MDGDASHRVVLDVLAVRARLTRAVLALPLELSRTAEVILVLEDRPFVEHVHAKDDVQVAGGQALEGCGSQRRR